MRKSCEKSRPTFCVFRNVECASSRSEPHNDNVLSDGVKFVCNCRFDVFPLYGMFFAPSPRVVNLDIETIGVVLKLSDSPRTLSKSHIQSSLPRDPFHFRPQLPHAVRRTAPVQRRRVAPSAATGQQAHSSMK